jgi:hypothetical protein
MDLFTIVNVHVSIYVCKGWSGNRDIDDPNGKDIYCMCVCIYINVYFFGVYIHIYIRIYRWCRIEGYRYYRNLHGGKHIIIHEYIRIYMSTYVYEHKHVHTYLPL